MLYISGDTHGDPTRFSSDNFPEQKEMTKEDYILICGDFGCVWGGNKTDDYWLNWLDRKNFTTLFCDGNHDNFDLLNSYPIEQWHGGKVHKIRPSVIHLMRGQIYDIEGKKFFVFGGASSHDIRDGILEIGDTRIKKWAKDYTKMFRINHISWWKEELPTEEEMKEGLDNLIKVNNKVDYIITHSPYTSLLCQIDGGSGLYKSDILTNYLQIIKQTTEYKMWLFGHMHINQMFQWEQSICIYEQITRLL